MIRTRVVVNVVIHYDTVRYATTNNVSTNEWHNEEFLSITSGCYKECGGILSADVSRACT